MDVEQRLRQNLSYDDFGIGDFLRQRRIHLKNKTANKEKYSTAAAAKFLGISEEEYRGIELKKGALNDELGVTIRQILNDPIKLKKLSDFLDIPYRKIERRVTKSIRQLEGKLKKCIGARDSLLYQKDMKQAAEQFSKQYAEYFSHHLKGEKLPGNIRKAIANIDKYSFSMFKLPVLPIPLFTILFSLKDAPQDLDFLHQVELATGQNETLSDYVRRCPYIGSFLFYAANRIFFLDEPKKSFVDCFHTLTVEQFKILLVVMLRNSGIYSYIDDLPALQSFFQFHTETLMMAKLLKSKLPDEVNYDELEMLLAMQNLGTLMLFVILVPSLNDENRQGTENTVVYNISREELEIFRYHYHPVLSAMMAGNWKYDFKIQKALLEHHSKEWHKVSPENAVLKLINRCTNEAYSQNENTLLDYLQDYPQLKLELDDLFSVVCSMESLQNELLRQSSSMLEDKSRQVSDAKKFNKLGEQSFEVKSEVVKIYKQTNIQAHPQILRAVINDCHEFYNELLNDVIFIRDHESQQSFQHRSFYLQMACEVVMYDHDHVAKKHNITSQDSQGCDVVDVDKLKRALKNLGR